MSELNLRLGVEFENIKSLGTPVERAVEFHVSKILAGDSVNVTSENQQIVDTIQDIYRWSNFLGKKSAIIRDFALLGDCFLKIRNQEDKILIEPINPDFVTMINKDSRGNVTEVRIDIPFVDDNGKAFWYVEYWDKADGANGYTSVWEHTLNRETPLDQLGEPKMFNPLATYGIDYLPIIHICFKDVNKTRGQSAVYHSLSKIDELNRIMTRLNEQVFIGSNRAWFLDISGADKGKDTISKGLSKNQKDGAIVEVRGSPISAVPDLPYDALLNVVNNMAEELIRDLPELRAYSISDASGLSGKSISLLLTPAIERALEAQSNFINGLIRANYAALTLGIANGIFPSSLGTYAQGSFEHQIVPNSMYITPIDEKAQALTSLTGAGIPLESAMRLAGFTEQEIEDVKEATPEPVSEVVNGAV